MHMCLTSTESQKNKSWLFSNNSSCTLCSNHNGYHSAAKQLLPANDVLRCLELRTGYSEGLFQAKKKKKNELEREPGQGSLGEHHFTSANP